MAAKGQEAERSQYQQQTPRRESKPTGSVAGAMEAVAKGVSRWEDEEVSKARG